MTNDSTFTLYNGDKIPAVGFGTWQIPNGDICYNAVTSALKSGYKHIDTALAYGNEQSVGKAIRDSGTERSEIYITSKLPAEIKSYEGALSNFEKTMTNLDTDYLDLYLIHAPWPWHQKGQDYTRENIEVWKAMEKIQGSGRCRAIGISNFNVKDMEAILANCSIKPMANQIRFFIGYTQEDVIRFCQDHDILVEGYSPLATGAILYNPEITSMARKYDTSVAQLCIRYVLQRGALPLPKSTHPERIAQNRDINFEIREEDMLYLNNLRDTTKTLFGART
jgi:diketogulonate reductase-like aldo/keto reductase